MRIEGNKRGTRFTPLKRVTLQNLAAGTISVKDGLGREYVHVPAKSSLSFIVGGALGYHTVVLADDAGRQIDTLTFLVDAQTQLDDHEGRFSELLQMLLYTIAHPTPHHGYLDDVRYHGRLYHIFACWLRYHLYILQGMKYFSSNLQDGIDLYRDSQRADGMIWDNVYPREHYPSYWDMTFAYDHFIEPVEEDLLEFRRIPVEADVEYLFVEGLYQTWKATGDDGWMEQGLDAAIKAMEYSVNSPYRWSEKYQLLKRAYTIDTWDFQAQTEYAAGGDMLHADKETTRFGVMFGDTTGYATACRALAEMLEQVGRVDEAAGYRERGQQMVQRLNELSWNGHFYTHYVPEQTDLIRDLGVDEASQLSLSNALSLNRGLPHEQCVEILKAYLHLRQHLPKNSPGEWYTIYPPFPRGFGMPWHYVNGGVSPLVAGELARGAFEHGYEGYAVDILLRLADLGQQHDQRFYGTYVGSLPESPARQFTPLDISVQANIDVSGEGRMGARGWTGEGENDLHELPNGLQDLAGIPFLIPDPLTNSGRGCIGLSVRDGYARRVLIPVESHVACIYFLHTHLHTGPSQVGGMITLHYADGSTFTQYVVRGKNVDGWWFPHAPDAESPRPVTAVAWRGCNAVCPNIGVIAYGLDNPYPELAVERITLTASEDGALWAVFGLTLSDQPAYFPPGAISSGIPDGCGAGPVIAALIEGLAGVVDQAVTFERVRLAPRWSAAQVQQAQVIVRYPDSSGYVAYHYLHDPAHTTIELMVTGSGEHCDCHLLLPPQAYEVLTVRDGDEHVAFTPATVEQSRYIDFALDLPGPHTLKITYRRAS